MTNRPMNAVEREHAIDAIARRKADFQLCFGSPAGTRVLKEMREFCYGDKSCMVVEPGTAQIDVHRTFALNGRREWFLRVNELMELPVEQLFERWYGFAYHRNVEEARKDDD